MSKIKSKVKRWWVPTTLSLVASVMIPLFFERAKALEDYVAAALGLTMSVIGLIVGLWIVALNQFDSLQSEKQENRDLGGKVTDGQIKESLLNSRIELLKHLLGGGLLLDIYNDVENGRFFHFRSENEEKTQEVKYDGGLVRKSLSPLVFIITMKDKFGHILDELQIPVNHGEWLCVWYHGDYCPLSWLTTIMGTQMGQRPSGMKHYLYSPALPDEVAAAEEELERS